MTKPKLTIILFLYLIIIFLFVIRNLKFVIPQNFLILGLDPRNDLLEKTQTTDTIIYANISPKYDSVKLFSLPRDLWFYQKSIKINQIY
ncbi:hypothetical protein COU93_00520, partial [Candidatus Shapirobacteria bacterium CG10_big_fil_rev_8_21_14_0_10_36_6]